MSPTYDVYVRLAVPAICPDCGLKMLYVEVVEEHYRFCPGPITLRFIDEGDPVAEVGSE
jgi:hypothetical protein